MPQHDKLLILSHGNAIVVTCKNRLHLENLKSLLKFSYLTQVYVGRRRKFTTVKEALFYPSLEAMCGDNTNAELDTVGKDHFVTYAGLQYIIEKYGEERGLEVRVANVSKDKFFEVEPDFSVLKDVALGHKQDEIIKAILSNNRGRIDASTGHGKSAVISWLCGIFKGARIVVTTHSISVLDMLYKTIVKVMGNRDVGIKCSKKSINTNARILCVSGKSLANLKFKPDVIFADEQHELCSEDYRRILSNPLFRTTRMYGFSANHERPDKRHYLMQALFGDILTDVSYQEAVKHKRVVPIIAAVQTVNMEYDPTVLYAGTERETALSGYAKDRKAIYTNSTRNQIIAATARQFGEDEQVMISVSKIEHALHLRLFLPEYELVYRGVGDKVWAKFKHQGLVPRDFKPLGPNGVEWMAKRFRDGEVKKVIVTSVWNRGVDFPDLSVVIRADAAASVIANTQIPGRVSRINGTKEYGLVVDFIDNWNDGFHAKSLARIRDYKKLGWEVKSFDEYVEASK